jgi:hypothetical protein
LRAKRLKKVDGNAQLGGGLAFGKFLHGRTLLAR